MEAVLCTTCHVPKGVYACGNCQNPVCKKCVQSLEKNRFPFLQPPPPELNHEIYCVNCYNQVIDPAIESYDETLERAKNVMVFHKGLSEETRLMSRIEKPISIEGSIDKAEATLRLAFVAAKAGFNTLLDVDVSPRKVRNAGFQTTKWHASGVPTTLDPKKYELKKK